MTRSLYKSHQEKSSYFPFFVKRHSKPLSRYTEVIMGIYFVSSIVALVIDNLVLTFISMFLLLLAIASLFNWNTQNIPRESEQ